MGPDQGHLRHRFAGGENFTKQIAFNVIPHIDVFMEGGETKEEWKMVVETEKFSIPRSSSPRPASRAGVRRPLGSRQYRVRAAGVRRGSAQRLARGAWPARGRQARTRRLRDARRMRRRFCDLFTRIREDQTIDNGLSFWVVSDNFQGRRSQHHADRRLIINRDLLEGSAA